MDTVSTKSRTRSKTRLSRALGIALTPKAAKYLEKRPYAPGEHGRTKRKQDSDYAVRLREKQRLRAQYGIREAQLKIQFEEARKAAGLTGENLVEQLEMRLDAIIVRSAIALRMMSSICAALTAPPVPSPTASTPPSTRTRRESRESRCGRGRRETPPGESRR